MQKDFLTIGEAAERMGVSRHRAYQLARAGLIPNVKRGRSLVVPVLSWNAFLTAQAEAAMGQLKGDTHAEVV